MAKAEIHLIDVTDFNLPDGSGSADWFSGAFETLGLGDRADLVIHDGAEGDLPAVPDCVGGGTGTIVSGSRGPVSEQKDWIPPLMDLIREIHSTSG